MAKFTQRKVRTQLRIFTTINSLNSRSNRTLKKTGACRETYNSSIWTFKLALTTTKIVRNSKNWTSMLSNRWLTITKCSTKTSKTKWHKMDTTSQNNTWKLWPKNNSWIMEVSLKASFCSSTIWRCREIETIWFLGKRVGHSCKHLMEKIGWNWSQTSWGWVLSLKVRNRLKTIWL